MDRHPSAASRPASPTRVLRLTPTKTKEAEVSPASAMRQELGIETWTSGLSEYASREGGRVSFQTAVRGWEE